MSSRYNTTYNNEYTRSAARVGSYFAGAVVGGIAEVLVGGMSGGQVAVTMAGGTLRMSDIVRRGDTIIINDQTLVVDHVGLLYISTKKDKAITYFPNTMLSSMPFSIQRFS